MVRLVVPTVVGVVLAAVVALLLVWMQTKAPSTNPAEAPILSYGQPAT